MTRFLPLYYYDITKDLFLLIKNTISTNKMLKH